MAKKSLPKSAASRSVEFLPAVEAARALIAQTRSYRVEGFVPGEFTTEYAIEGLTFTLGVLLGGIDYQENIASLPAVIARSLACCIANMEDHVRALS